MAPLSLPVKVLSESDRGTGILYGIAVAAAPAELEALLSALPPLAEFASPDPSGADGALEVKALPEGLQIKHGRHGSYGTWRAATLPEAIAWVLPGVASLEAQRVGCSLWIPRLGA